MTQPKIDQKWYERFLHLSTISIVDVIEGDFHERMEQKKLFLHNDIQHPLFTYPHIPFDRISHNIDQYRLLQQEIIEKERHPIVVQAYTEKINEKILAHQLLKAIHEQEMTVFSTVTESLYGRPSKRVFFDTVQKLQTFLLKTEKSLHTDLAFENFAQAQKILHTIDVQDEAIDITAQQYAIVAQHIHAECAPVDDFFISQRKAYYTAQDIQSVLSTALQIFLLSDWSVEIKGAHSVAIVVHHYRKKIYIPADIKKSKEELYSVVIHEVYTHVLRRVHGEQSPLQLLGVGFPKSYFAEEGIAIIREEALFPDKVDLRRLLLHFGISMGNGIDGTLRTFRDIYTLLYPFFFLDQFLKQEDDMMATRYAQEHAWNTTVRIFRGTDCHTPGVVFTKDMSYREGRAQMWNLIREHPSEVARFNAGKYHPGNAQHRQWLDELGLF